MTPAERQKRLREQREERRVMTLAIIDSIKQNIHDGDLDIALDQLEVLRFDYEN